MSRRVDGPSCESVLERLEPWIDGELLVDEAAAISAHIEICSTCSEESTLAKRILAELRGFPELDTPHRVLRAVQRETGGRSPLDRAGRIFRVVPRLPGRALVAVAAVLLIALAGHFWRVRTAPQFSDQEVRRASAEARYALAFVATITHRVEEKVRTQVLEGEAVSASLRGISQCLDWTRDAGVSPPAENQSIMDRTERSPG